MGFLRKYFLAFCFRFPFLVEAFQIDVPANFYGSPEVFSGYLSNSDHFKEAFTLHDDHFIIAGSTPEVEHALGTVETKSNSDLISFILLAWLFIIKSDFKLVHTIFFIFRCETPRRNYG